MGSADGLATATHSISGNVVTVDLAAVANAQVLSVALINTKVGTNVGTVDLPVGILRGDTNANRTVNSGDSTQTKARAGQTASAANFRSDVNEDAVINSGDSNIVKASAGTAAIESRKYSSERLVVRLCIWQRESPPSAICISPFEARPSKSCLPGDA